MKELRKYLRDENGHPRGVIVATGRGQVGWSAVHPRDRFNKELGLRIARGRASVGNQTPGALPAKYLHEFEIMDERSRRYFK